MGSMAIATTPEADIEREAERLLAAAEAEGIPIRLIGGMAIRLLAGPRLHPAFRREVQDLDFVVPRQRAVALEKLLVGGGYRPNQEFNALNAARRMLFDDVGHGRQVDVFVGRFEMCHRLPLVERIELRPGSLPAADVLMTKLQIVSLNEKDRRDIFALLHSHEIARGDEDAINLDRIVELTSHDWGLQRTFELNLGRLSEALPGLPLDAADRAELGQRIEAISTAIDEAPKSRKWRLRARVGERVQWYEEPEEVDRG
jgi:hypothetical protein